MYTVITSEMRLYDRNWWQPVVIFRWLMMQASVRGNRSKQFTQQGTIVVAPSPAPTESVSPCARVHVGFCLAKRERAQGGNGGLCS